MSTDPLIDAATLAAQLDRPSAPTLLDVRWQLGASADDEYGADEYAAGHLPGAVFLDIDTQLCGPPGRGGRHPLPDPRRLEAVLRAAGVWDGKPVVVYDAGVADLRRRSAARAWWTLRWAGHEQVRVLDGGYAAWVAAGYPVTTARLPQVPGDATVRPGSLPVLDADGAAELAADGRLADVRAPERYRGEMEPVDPVAGHIPGAVNLPTAAHLAPDGRVPEPAEVRERSEQAGLPPQGPVGAYCGSGVAAASAVLAWHRAGRTDAALYVGSWSHWITDPQRPVAKGA